MTNFVVKHNSNQLLIVIPFPLDLEIFSPFSSKNKFISKTMMVFFFQLIEIIFA